MSFWTWKWRPLFWYLSICLTSQICQIIQICIRQRKSFLLIKLAVNPSHDKWPLLTESLSGSCRNHSKPHLRPTVPIADRSSGLLDSPGLFPSFPNERLLNGVRSSPPMRLPTSQSRTRLPSTTSFPRRDTVGTGRVIEPTTTDYSLGMGRGRCVADTFTVYTSQFSSFTLASLTDFIYSEKWICAVDNCQANTATITRQRLQVN